MDCQKCNYKWKPKVVAPKCCPNCKARLNLPPRTIVFAEDELKELLQKGVLDIVDLKTGETIRVVRRLVE